jgi:hypothetical protein
MSDESMSAWMEYIFMQKTMPINAKGVNVTLSIVDPNGNSFVLGDAISDLAGTYGYSWTPEIEGTYQITATFGGSNSYGSSYDTTYLTVSKAATQPTIAPTQAPTEAPPTATPTVVPTSTQTVAPQPSTDYTTALYVAVAAVVVIVAIALAAVLLRRRK